MRNLFVTFCLLFFIGNVQSVSISFLISDECMFYSEFDPDNIIVYGNIDSLETEFVSAIKTPEQTYKVDINGGVWNNIDAHGSSKLNIFSGTIGCSRAGDFSEISFYNGNIECLYSVESGIINVHGGYIQTLLAGQNSIINIYGYNFNYNESLNILSGFWGDDTPFQIQLQDWGSSTENSITYNHIVYHETIPIPEPATIAFLGLGVFALRRKCKRN